MQELHIRQAAKRIVSSFLARKAQAEEFAVGDVVKSEFRSRWFGVVVEVEERKLDTPLVEVIITHDRHGNLVRKPFYKRIDSAWLKLAPDMYEAVTTRAKAFGYRF